VTIATYSFPTTIRFGVGARRLVGPSLSDRGIARPLVVTDKGVADLPIHGELLDDLRGAGLEPGSFGEVWGNPVESQVVAGVEAYRAHGADAIVGLGGGAALDVAKAIGLLATHPGDLFDYEDEVPGSRPIDDRIPWFVALPTTAGTGSEVGRSAVIADDVTHVKRIVFSPHLLAREVFADPELTAGLPPALTAATGMDALTHNVEAYLAKDPHPICDGIAVEGVRLCAANLAPAVHDGRDLDARAGMLMASMMGAIAFQKGLGLVHSCAHALGTAADLHHGLANALMIDHALRFNVPSSGDRMAYLASAIGLDDPSPERFLSWLEALKDDIGVAPTLAAHGLDRGLAGQLTELATDDACHANNPRPVAADDFRGIFEAAFGSATTA
jgi:alcohol dehydrogenase class IV